MQSRACAPTPRRPIRGLRLSGCRDPARHDDTTAGRTTDGHAVSAGVEITVVEGPAVDDTANAAVADRLRDGDGDGDGDGPSLPLLVGASVATMGAGLGWWLRRTRAAV
jgi:hypothetical protein